MIRFSRRCRFARLGLFAPLLLPAAHVLAQPLPDRRPLLGRITGFHDVPLGGAFVSLRRTDDNQPATFWGTRILTDARGEFAIPDAEDGSYYVSVEADGYAPDNNHAWTLSASSGRLQITMLKLSDLKLRLLQADGTVLSSKPVSLRLKSSSGPRVTRISTDANGLITVPGLVPGTYSVEALVSGTGWATLEGAEVSPETQAAPLEMRMQQGGAMHVVVHEAGEGTPKPIGGATLFVTPAPGDDAQARAQGRLSTVPGADMTLLWVHNDRAGLVSRESDGSIDLSDLAPGRYLLRPFFAGYNTPEAQSVEVKAGETATLDFALASSAPNTQFVPVTMLLRDANGKPLANADWTIQLRFAGAGDNGPPPPPPPPGMADGVPPELIGGSMRRAHSDADGKIVLYPVRVGRYRVSVQSGRDANPQIELPATTVVAAPGATDTIIRSGQ